MSRASRAPFSAQRQHTIVPTLKATGRVDVADVAADLGVTAETVHKDLIRLQQEGLLRRVHGGAVPIEHVSFEAAVSTRIEFTAEMKRIARAALEHLPAEGSVLLDAGTTTALLADIFPTDRPLTVFTNTLPIAICLLTRPNLTVHTLGGRVRVTTSAEVGHWADHTLRDLNVDVAFLGTNALWLERGLTTPDPAEAATKHLMLATARRCILLADHSKVGRVSDLDLFITDSASPDETHEALVAAGLPTERV